MDEIQNDDLDISTQEEQFDYDAPVEQEEVFEEEEIDWKAEALKNKELYENQKKRAEKAERDRKAKEGVTTQAPEQKKDDLSSSDLYALMSSKVPQEDIGDVKEYANMKGISIPEALKSNVVKTILKDKEDMRNVAEASHTGRSRGVSNKVSDEALVENARKGNLPENEADIRRLIQAYANK